MLCAALPKKQEKMEKKNITAAVAVDGLRKNIKNHSWLAINNSVALQAVRNCSTSLMLPRCGH